MMNHEVAKILKRLKKQTLNEGSAEKLKVDEDDLAVDFFQYYQSDTFNARVPIKVQIRHQPATDSGGVLHIETSILHYFWNACKK